jgi:hypothetical protein
MNLGKTTGRFAKRRIRSAAIAIVLTVVFVLVIAALNQTLNHGSHVSGYVLFVAIVFLALFNLRKKLTFLPMLGTARAWMQLHIYVGLSTFIMFGVHLSWRIPNGQFEMVLAGLYLFVALSGVYGLYITRVLPKRLTNLPEEIIYERIPAFRKRLTLQARELVLSAAETSDVLARFYANRLAAFFEQPRSFSYVIKPSSRQCRQLVSEIQDLDRYLSSSHREVGKELAAIVKQKDDLDYHHAIQGRLKVWLFVHIATTYSLLLFAVLHGIMAHAFGGGLR